MVENASKTQSAGMGHLAIAASAGTGKTYALAHRYLRLVRDGVPPERVCALTFSRKAAGEIFDEIIRHTCAAATNPAAAARSSLAMDAATDCEKFRAMLRAIVADIHRLHVGTIDSFVAGVVRAFPFELGLSPDFRVGDADGADDDVRRALFIRLFDPAVTSAETRRDFLEAFKQATFGEERKTMDRALEAFITELVTIHRRIPSAKAWGHPEPVWGGPPSWRRLPPDERALAAKTVLAAAPTDAAVQAQFAKIVEFLRDYDDRSEWRAELERLTIFSRLWDALKSPPATPLEFPFGKKKYILPEKSADALRALLGHVMAVELARVLTQTAGVERVLACYERLYAEYMRRTGRLGFDDLARLVAGGEGLSPSRLPDKPGRLFIDYRLDARLDHWLLDEFQDTSDLQWRVLGNLVDEVVQDDSGTRSFFYVGDVKQAIYGWRGGNYRLFSQIAEKYGDAIARSDLDVSHRSAPVIIDAVNRIFGGLADEEGLPPQTRDDWQNIWRTHESARSDETGCVELLEAVADENSEESQENAQYRLLAKRLVEINPLARGLTAAVLLRTNEQARRCADALRAHLPAHMPVALEGAASLLDNPLVPLMLSLVRVAAHPGDTFAWQHVQMSPLGQGAATPDALSPEFLTRIQADGFQRTLHAWCARLEAAQPLDAFTRQRRDDLLDAAAAFDATGECDCDRFVRFIENYSRHDTASETAIRVMTIHQSKGLGFDFVGVPFDAKSESFSKPKLPDMLESARGDWVLRSPRSMVVEADATLLAVEERQRADAAFAKLCVFYVALTRARQGLCLVVSPAPKKSEVVREDTLLRSRLAGEASADSRVLFRSGDVNWHLARPLRAEKIAVAKTAAETAPLLPGASHLRLQRIEPSQTETVSRPAALCFQREAGDVRLFGTAIHRLFQQIEWLETFDVERTIAAWRASATEPEIILRDVERQFRTSLSAPDVQRALRRPDGDCTLWREKPFELLHQGKLLAGQFDRVVMERDCAGRATRATILDFKSNRVESDAALAKAAAHYHEQMALYAAAMRHIIGDIPVTTALLFTRAGRVAVIPERAK